MASPDPHGAEPLAEVDRVLVEELLALEGAMERNYEWVYELIAPYLGHTLLEVGSGVGVMSKYLIARGAPIVLSDYHPVYLRHLRARFGGRPHVDFQLLDLNRRPYELARPVDTIVCLNVLEHIEDDCGALRGLARLLTPGGRLVLQVPNYPALFGSLDESYGHFRRYTRQSLAACLNAAGFRVVALRNFNPLAIPGWVVSAKLRRARRLNVRAVRFFNTIIPLARRVDCLARFGGLALIACAERPADPVT